MEASGLVWSGRYVVAMSVSNWIKCCVPQIFLPSFSSLPSVETNGSFQDDFFTFIFANNLSRNYAVGISAA
jgi:hypothetical protein